MVHNKDIKRKKEASFFNLCLGNILFAPHPFFALEQIPTQSIAQYSDGFTLTLLTY